jgi:hypothetical protein
MNVLLVFITIFFEKNDFLYSLFINKISIKYCQIICENKEVSEGMAFLNYKDFTFTKSQPLYNEGDDKNTITSMYVYY